MLWCCQVGRGDLQVFNVVKGTSPQLQHLLGATEHHGEVVLPKTPQPHAHGHQPGNGCKFPLQHVCSSLPRKKEVLNSSAACCPGFIPLWGVADGSSIPPPHCAKCSPHPAASQLQPTCEGRAVSFSLGSHHSPLRGHSPETQPSGSPVYPGKRGAGADSGSGRG